jgi:hypothetical protein
VKFQASFFLFFSGSSSHKLNELINEPEDGSFLPPGQVWARLEATLDRVATMTNATSQV